MLLRHCTAFQNVSQDDILCKRTEANGLCRSQKTVIINHEKGTNLIAKPGHPSLLQDYTGLPLYITNYFLQVAESNVATPKSLTTHWCIMQIIFSHCLLSVLPMLLFTAFLTVFPCQPNNYLVITDNSSCSTIFLKR